MQGVSMHANCEQTSALWPNRAAEGLSLPLLLLTLLFGMTQSWIHPPHRR